ncbi:uncharacterized protein LOC121050756 isoform X2 [Rosa chinensis]|uniref:uncharacterized protein LOC121050756 isoform X2 n=1 Tax=Rosa chinensis TaxID=74649 RepID=UPI001AD8BCA7|nr:uncharacterized protein LOC121050756 isoform X2 [Rosa chinensis]
MNRFPRPRPSACSLNLPGNVVDFPALSVVNNVDVMRVVIVRRGRFVARVRDQPIPADPPLPHILGFPLLGDPIDPNVVNDNEELVLLAGWIAPNADVPGLVENEPPGDPVDPNVVNDNEELVLLAGWIAPNADGPSLVENEPPVLEGELPPVLEGELPPVLEGDLAPAPKGGLPPAPIGGLVASTMNTAANAASAMLVAAANAASATPVAAANAASAMLVAAATAVSAKLVAAATAASAKLVAAATAASALLLAAADEASALLMAASSVLTTAETFPVWLVSLIVGFSFALSISNAAYIHFFLDICFGAMWSFAYDRILHHFLPSSRSLPRGTFSGWVSMAVIWMRRF